MTTTNVDYSQKSSKPRKKIHRSTSDIDESDDSDEEETLSPGQRQSQVDVIAQRSRKEILRQTILTILARMMDRKKSRVEKADNK